MGRGEGFCAGNELKLLLVSFEVLTSNSSADFHATELKNILPVGHDAKHVFVLVSHIPEVGSRTLTQEPVRSVTIPS